MGLFSKKECDVCKKKMALMEDYKRALLGYGLSMESLIAYAD